MPAVILILDAEPIVRQVVISILERAGFTVLAAGDLREAEELARGCAPDLLLTNVYVPGSTGRDAASLLRRVCPEMRALLVAGLPDEEPVREAMAERGLEFFPKPFTANELTAKVRELLYGASERTS
jgi:two-component system, cell cycle sensor histidine kinase and response regulator CckA